MLVPKNGAPKAHEERFPVTLPGLNASPGVHCQVEPLLQHLKGSGFHLRRLVRTIPVRSTLECGGLRHLPTGARLMADCRGCLRVPDAAEANVRRATPWVLRITFGHVERRTHSSSSPDHTPRRPRELAVERGEWGRHPLVKHFTPRARTKAWLLIPVPAPFTDIPQHIQAPVRTRAVRECSYRRKGEHLVVGVVVHGAIAEAADRWVRSPGKRAAIRAPRCLLPFHFCGKAFTRPFTVRQRVVPAYKDYGHLLEPGRVSPILIPEKTEELGFPGALEVPERRQMPGFLDKLPVLGVRNRGAVDPEFFQLLRRLRNPLPTAFRPLRPGRSIHEAARGNAHHLARVDGSRIQVCHIHLFLASHS